ncbi:MAG TPA: ISAs1 family transposase [Desulfomonilaceae bacterium]|nr:ISAs1 family transposase [Desulfomonilaceae bacterium]
MESNTQAGLVFDVGSLFARFQTLSDKRKPRGRRYSLALILLLILLAKTCGENHPSGIAEWARHRAALLVDHLQLKRKQMPHHSTYRRILAEVVNVEELEEVSSEYLSGKKYFGKQVLVAIDGKVLRGTLDEAQKGTTLLAAYLPKEGIVLMEVAIAEKSSEIPAAPQLLKRIDLRDKVVMGDALHTQRPVSTQIVESGGEYIWFAKGNQPQMEEEIRLWFDPDVQPIPGMSNLPKDFEIAQETNKGHGRLETRTITVSSQLNGYLDWPYLEQVFKLERHFISTKTGEIQEQTEYGFTSLSRDDIVPLKLLEMTRSYWGIETGLHYRRDVTLREDYTRMSKGKMAQAMACLNNLILGILLAKKNYPSIPAARRYFSANPGEALDLFLRL